jgi:ATP-dependent Lon protease
MDRMEKIEMPLIQTKKKIVIAKKYILPKVLKEVGLRNDQFIIREEMWTKMVRPLGFDAGIRTLQRTIQSAARKAARIIVEGQHQRVEIGEDNYKIFLPSY